MLKAYQRKTIFVEFSRDVDREKLKIRKNDVTLQWLPSNGFSCNDYVAMVSLQWFLLLPFAYVYKQSNHLS